MVNGNAIGYRLWIWTFSTRLNLSKIFFSAEIDSRTFLHVFGHLKAENAQNFASISNVFILTGKIFNVTLHPSNHYLGI